MIAEIHFAAPAADFNDVNMPLIIYFYILYFKYSREKGRVNLSYIVFIVSIISEGKKKIGYCPLWGKIKNVETEIQQIQFLLERTQVNLHYIYKFTPLIPQLIKVESIMM